ncbi:PH domain protein [Opisthorchis viverrini]|nr:PH domain protein [Opisthorchis viverrini]
MRVQPGNLSPTRRLEALHAMTGTRVFQEKLQNMKSRLPIHLSDASFYGWLYKMGHRRVLQQWKKRFFVLNTDRHQLVYYDTSADEVVRGCVDLQEVRAVRIIKNFVPHQLRGVDCAVFELETNGRTYRFAAESAAQANEWIERIQNTIQ